MIFEKGELFCGPGGLSLGALKAKVTGKNGELFAVKHKWASDYDPAAVETYRENICKPNNYDPKTVFQKDVRELKIDELEPINAFAFGFPCNDYSLVGEKKGINGEFGPLYSYGVKVLASKEPQWFIAENVSGLESANEGQAFQQILNDLENAGPGYMLTPHLYKFEEYGVPQTRRRIIIVGIRKNLNLQFKVPAPTHGPGNFVTAKQALEGEPIPEDAPNQEPTRHHQRVIDMLSFIPPGENAWSEKIPPALRLNVKGARMSQIYRRLKEDAPSYTVTGSGGGGTHIYHYRDLRALTNRERARLQTFPDKYDFKGGKEAVRKQIGMAVPPDGAKVIIEAILKTFAGIEYDSVPSKWSVNSQEKSNSELELAMQEIAAASEK
ncbi:DNA (cytosine-5-)-methyltransferase [Paenibacillus sp. GP183]|uniref:DNA cytosine methyltransferase n=1 Tax=Paenibacillus sp. GP183 TaxID=1882751 RepID=UPI00089C84DB|nr:DNA (cytosine-5-)-methyltransferase [Paenibacillus sp. GP183]SED14911.1 DNA (cytosine-5)-methyltransferase 1 [Paenibacillus sp. GP183]